MPKGHVKLFRVPLFCSPNYPKIRSKREIIYINFMYNTSELYIDNQCRYRSMNHEKPEILSLYSS